MERFPRSSETIERGDAFSPRWHPRNGYAEGRRGCESFWSLHVYRLSPAFSSSEEESREVGRWNSPTRVNSVITTSPERDTIAVNQRSTSYAGFISAFPRLSPFFPLVAADSQSRWESAKLALTELISIPDARRGCSAVYRSSDPVLEISHVSFFLFIFHFLSFSIESLLWISNFIYFHIFISFATVMKYFTWL